ncbi:M16 family metallopeptidase [Falsirhodobacter xinxiangensis]|uniref:M16 family metallopeptidase n=1 Tax=Falsirhodobacter xinxiangensis TaxID=2530049 RepID=UPI0010AA4BCC|nr:pitrilysin family protein [Rhodobacter xinxiangensis]
MKMLRHVAALILFALPAHAAVDIKQVTSPGGITAWLVEEHEIPFTALEIRFQGGTSLDAHGKRGAVNLMTATLEEGTGEMDAQGFANARDSLAASYRFEAGTDSVAVSARFLSENRDQAVDLLRQALVAPSFEQSAVDRVKGQVQSILQSDAQDPNAIAARIFDTETFGDHPYATSGNGTADSVAALTRDDLVAAHKAAITRERIYVSAVGDISEAELGKLLDDLLGDLPETGAALPDAAPWNIKGGVTVHDFPTPQSVVYFGHQGIKRDDPDFFPAYVLSEILGGGRFTARLMDELRGKRGLTYGAYAYLAPMDHAELLVGRFATANATVGQAIDVVREQWSKLATEGVTQAELDATKTYLTGSYPLRFDSNAAIANILVGMQMEGLPIDYALTRNEKVEAVTLDDVRRVAARVLRPDDLHFVVVGQPEGLEQ